MQIPEDQFENVFSVTFLGSDREEGRSRVRLESGQELFIPYLPKPASPRLQIRIAADDIIIGTRKPEGVSAGNVLTGTVRSIELVNGQAVITVLAGDEFHVRLTASAVRTLRLAEQTPVFLIIKTRSFHLA
jgi:molybdate transport system ATP-binding protein